MNTLVRAVARAVSRGRPGRGPPSVKGLTLPRPRVAPTVEALRAFQRDFERVFLALAERLPSLDASVQALTAPFASLQDPATGLAARIGAQVEAMTGTRRAATNGVLTLGEAGQEQAQALGAGATELAGVLGSVERLSLTLRLAGLNASFSADGLGPRGAAFTAVDQALIEVADTAAELAVATGAGATLTHQAAARLGEGQQALAVQLAQLTTDAEARSWAAMLESTQRLQQLGTELEDISARGREVAAATGQVMTAIQHQDILRQGLDHVIGVLEALGAEAARLATGGRAAASPMAYLQFQVRAGGLASDLLGSLQGQLEALVGSVERPVGRLGEAARAFATRTLDQAGLERSLSAASEHLADGFASLPGASEVDACQAELAALEEGLDGLRQPLQELERVPLRLEVVAILLRAEIAHLDELAELARVAEELREAGAGLRELNAAATTSLAAVRARLPLVRGVLERQRGAWEELRRLPARLAAPVAEVRGMASGLKGHLDRLQAAGHGVERQVAPLLADLRRFAQALALTASVREACEGWRDEAAALAAQLEAQGLRPAEPPPALQALIDGFTLFEHKQIALAGAGEPGAAPLPDASAEAGAPGELTLF